jgi:hypothetical protein
VTGKPGSDLSCSFSLSPWGGTIALASKRENLQHHFIYRKGVIAADSTCYVIESSRAVLCCQEVTSSCREGRPCAQHASQSLRPASVCDDRSLDPCKKCGKKVHLPSCFHIKNLHVAFGTNPTVLLVSTRAKFKHHVFQRLHGSPHKSDNISSRAFSSRSADNDLVPFRCLHGSCRSCPSGSWLPREHRLFSW